MAEIRQVHGPGPFTLVFDRGGFSADAFRFLNAEHVGFLTYLKGRRPKRRVPRSRFRRSWFAFEGTRQAYHIYEKTTRVGRAGAIRTILFLGHEDQQVPVLTNLDAAVRPAKVCLQRPDAPKIAHALDALLGTLNRKQPRLLGDDPILHFTLAEPLNKSRASKTR